MRLYLASLIMLLSASAFAVDAWECTDRAIGQESGYTQVRLERKGSTYSVYLTASSSDVGPHWKIKDELVADGLDCKFSKVNNALYCVVSKTGVGFTTVSASEVRVDYVDQSTGEDKSVTNTSVILSGTPEILNKFEHSVLKFSADTCSQQ